MKYIILDKQQQIAEIKITGEIEERLNIFMQEIMKLGLIGGEIKDIFTGKEDINIIGNSDLIINGIKINGQKITFQAILVPEIISLTN